MFNPHNMLWIIVFATLQVSFVSGGKTSSPIYVGQWYKSICHFVLQETHYSEKKYIQIWLKMYIRVLTIFGKTKRINT